MAQRRRPVAFALVLIVALAGGAVIAPPAAAQGEESPEDLPAGKGREEAFYTCTACHGFAIIRSQGLSRERWDATIDDMVARQMPAPDADDRALILDYLAAAFPPRQRVAPNPFLR